MKALFAKLFALPLVGVLLQKYGRPLAKRLFVLALGAGAAFLSKKLGVEILPEQVASGAEWLVGLLFAGFAHFIVVDGGKLAEPAPKPAEEKIADLEAALRELRGQNDK